MVKTFEEKQAMELAIKFIKTGLRGSKEDKIRNKLGNKAWPLAQKITRYGGWGGVGILAASAIMGAPVTLPSILVIGSSFLVDKWAQGHVQFLQNVTLRQAAFFGRLMKNANVPETVRQKAIEYFLQKESPLFTAKKYLKKNPDMVTRLKDGQMAKLNKNFVSFFDENTHALSVSAAKEKRAVTFSERLDVYRKTWRQFKAAKAEEETQNKVAPEKGEAVVHSKKTSFSRLEESLNRAQVLNTYASVFQKSMSESIKTEENGAKRLLISANLMKQINSETMKKTGSKIADIEAIKVGAKENPILEAVFRTILVAENTLKGIQARGETEFCSGASSLGSTFDASRSSNVDKALIARDLAGSRS